MTAPSPNAPSIVARLAAQAARMKAARAAAVGQLTSALPSLDAQEAEAALVTAVPIPVRGAARFLEELAGHLAAHPDALTSGSSLCPPVLLRLAEVLHDAGHPVVRPGCAHCGKLRSDLRQLRPEGRLCGTCDARSRQATCARCGRENVRIAARRPEGRICYTCYHSDPEIFEECAECGQSRAPAVRRKDGRALCRSCWKRPMHTCVNCGKTAAAALVDDDGALCHLCYNRHRRPRRLCGRCGQLKRIARNARDGQPDLCDCCYRGPEVACSGCGRTRPCNRNQQGQPVCGNCYRRTRSGEPCARCGRTKPVNTRWPIGPVCMSCYTAVLRSPAECSRCGTVEPLIARDDDGDGVCGPCVGFAADYTCRQCGRAGKPHGHGRCAHCVLAERINALLTGPDGTVAQQMKPLAAALADAPSPFPAIQWLKESPNTKLLAQLAAEGHELTHELLDELPPSRNQRYIRQLLVHTGILDERNEDIERIPGWLEHELADKPAAHANLARPFLHWFLLRRARQRAATRRHPASADRDLRRRVSVALDFLAWIDQRGLPLADLAQEHVDDWIAGATSQRRYLIRHFLKWTMSRRLTRELTVPSIPRQEPQNLLDEDDRWPLLQRCLTDDTLQTDVRAAGAITLLFGPSTERLCHLTPEHLKFGDKHTHLVLGRHPVLLPPRLAELLRRLAEQPELRPQLSRVHPGSRWLFPGMVPGKPISTHGMTQKLNRHGIPVRTARNAALAALAADLPSPILADVTGMHRQTALRWVAYARRDWAEYLAARAEEEANKREKKGNSVSQ
ncbi:XRE family transcriptional regulator [Streptomyces sp. QL37]|uniref:Cro/Cl family transcriptional regulator n=1 Tax=Streptomyces sp. QL37 TaxID=2093747 RepID=UPI000CF2B2DA|nr:Cro/Cl family transcriptional regulator [Streptomyces sp. QL37]PPQ56333.1 Cro/Cl family transcriptional regulator [Streptomyces sp. QL37]